jgi:hypothetical protein
VFSVDLGEPAYGMGKRLFPTLWLGSKPYQQASKWMMLYVRYGGKWAREPYRQ